MEQGDQSAMAIKTTRETVAVPKEEYQILKEIYQNVKRQQFLMRMAEAEKNLKAGRVKKISMDQFIESL